MIYYILYIALLYLVFIPVLMVYVALCAFLPFFCRDRNNILKEQESKDNKIFIVKDSIHSDFVFHSSDWNSIFITEKKYIMIGWGDRGIFLETKTWPELKLDNVMRAFFGLNDSVIRIKFLDRLPECYQTSKIDKRQFEYLKNYIMSSFLDFQEIKKEDDYCEDGCYYRSKLKYNCINTCNNWVNTGLYKAKLTTRTWAPLSFNVNIKN